ncbi:MAG: DUF418 domain-containing protein [Rhizobacter sp.]|nr:DUF418 domain-containing protein [Ferruginibacter sp.]
MTLSNSVQPNERSRILDILRGIALLGIILANYPVISLWVFQGPQVWETMPTAKIDMPLGFFHFAFLDGKFYTLFSLLFGIGFSIILLRSQQKSTNGLAVFYRRLFILLLIGLFHSFFLWMGDILLLYALIGMLLPFFRNVSDKNLLIISVTLILSPLLVDALRVISDNKINFSAPLEKMTVKMEDRIGITDDNFSTWLIKHKTYGELLKFNSGEFFMRWQMLIASNRPLKVLGIFILGLYVGRKLIYARLEENKVLLKKIRLWGFIIGIPVSLVYSFVEITGERLPDPKALLNTAAYALSVVPLSLAYTSTLSLWYLKNNGSKFLNLFAAPGRMALTNYLLQSVTGICIFYGVGFGLGAKTGLAYVLLIAIAVYMLQIIYSHLWLKYFNYGPCEWIWRMLTYGKFLKIRKVK